VNVFVLSALPYLVSLSQQSSVACLPMEFLFSRHLVVSEEVPGGRVITGRPRWFWCWSENRTAPNWNRVL